MIWRDEQWEQAKPQVIKSGLHLDGIFDLYYNEHSPKYIYTGAIQTVPTPLNLCREIVGELNKYCILNGKKILVLNTEFVEALLFYAKDCEIVFFADNEAKAHYIKDILSELVWDSSNRIVVVGEESRNFLEWRTQMQFDVIVGNPPYQAQGRKHGGVCGRWSIIWDKIVLLCDELLVRGGYLCLIHPSGWRDTPAPQRPNDELQRVICKDRHLLYLEIHGEKDGMKFFGAETRFDWYISGGTGTGHTQIKCQDDCLQSIDIASWNFIPNCEFDLFIKLLARDGEERVNILHNCEYHTQRDYIENEKSEVYKYPVIYTVPKSGIPKLKWSSKKNKHFGVPKLVYSTGRPISVGMFLDIEGEYGLTQFATGIVDKPAILPKIKQALDSNKFRKFCRALAIGKLEINTNAIRLFRKDFWKEFVN